MENTGFEGKSDEGEEDESELEETNSESSEEESSASVPATPSNSRALAGFALHAQWLCQHANASSSSAAKLCFC